MTTVAAIHRPGWRSGTALMGCGSVDVSSVSVFGVTELLLSGWPRLRQLTAPLISDFSIMPDWTPQFSAIVA